MIFSSNIKPLLETIVTDQGQLHQLTSQCPYALNAAMNQAQQSLTL